jgi:predicted phosphate transport protein (TIGR00153 family)
MLIFNNKNPKVSKCFADHHEDVVSCLEKFEEFMKESFAENANKDKLISLKAAVDNCENAADGELRHVVDLLSDSFLPTTRTHMITLVQSTDDVANLCQEIVRHVMLEKIQFPAAIREDLLEIIAITKVQLSILYKAVDLLINDFKTLNDDRKVLDDVRAEESKVDNIQAALHERIFTLDISLAEKVYYRDMMEHICDLSDMIEDISDKIQIMLIEREA